jgi:hypothetical protein
MGFQYFKFVIKSVRNNNDAEVQFSDIHVTYNGNRVDYSSATASANGINIYSTQDASKGIDDNINTKFCGSFSNLNNTYFLINFNKIMLADAFYYVTAEDVDKRDPISWEVFVSMDGINYTLVNTTTNATITRNRKTATQSFSLSSPACFNKGTKILCLNKQFEEEYIPIENLKKGDLVKSYKHGYRKIDLIGKNSLVNNPDKFNECMYKMIKTEENGLIEDLIVTGYHSILVDNLEDHTEKTQQLFGTIPMIDNKYLLVSSISNDFVKMQNNKLYTYYHFVLENNSNDDEQFGIWANGILSETICKNLFLRKHFITNYD